MWDIATNTKEIQRIVREYFENPYSNELEILKEINKFLNAFNLPKFSQEDINHLNRPITSNDIEAVIEYPKKKIIPGLMDSLPNPTRPLKKN
jgi:hypothetical protein